MLYIDAEKKYNHQLVIAVPALQLEEAIYWMKGSNGSGKTTLLQMIAGLIPFDGDIVIENLSVKKHPVVYRKEMGWAEAEPLYPPFLAGAELVSFFQKVYRETDKNVDDLLALFRVNDYIHQPVRTYSSGMIKKLSLVLAFIGNKKWILLDEPFITLDSEAVDQLEKLIQYTHQTQGTGFLITSHQDPAADLLAAAKTLIVSNQRLTCQF